MTSRYGKRVEIVTHAWHSVAAGKTAYVVTPAKTFSCTTIADVVALAKELGIDWPVPL